MRVLILAIVAVALSSCTTVRQLDAGNDVHSLLIAIRDGDGPRFERYVDRRALQRELEVRLVREAASRDRRLTGAAVLLAPSLASAASDAFIQPDAFRAVADYYGYKPAQKIPSPVAISQALRPLPDGSMCAVSKKDGPCLLDFTKGPDGHWKLSGFEGELSMLRLKL